MKFELTEEQAKRVRAWAEEQDRIVAASQSEETTELGMGGAYYGAIGGELTYEFTPTSIGTLIKVRHAVTKAVLEVDGGSCF